MTLTSSAFPQQALARRPRADARRNHARLLAEAARLFEERGADASLDEIARRAGVGIGTLYRHFPTRRALLEAVLADSIAALCAEADALLCSPAPAEALAAWLRAVVEHAATYQGLAAELLCDPCDPERTTCGSCQAMRAAGARLLARAQTYGDVRPDIDAEDLFTIVNGLAWSTEQAAAGRERRARLLALMLDGLKAGS